MMNGHRIDKAVNADTSPDVSSPIETVFLNPGAPVANKAVSVEKPLGTPGGPPNATVLQQHVLFWDRSGSGIIWPWDTYIGFRRLGFNIFLSLLAVPLMHTLAIFTSPTIFINPLLPLHIKNLHKTKHGSDSETFDTEGRFVPQKFEEIFTKYDRGNKGGLDWDDIKRMCNGNQNAGDVFGGIGTRGEWFATWLLLHDNKGVVSKEKILAMYDGSIWQLTADEVAAKRAGKKSVKEEAYRNTGVGNTSFTSTRGMVGTA